MNSIFGIGVLEFIFILIFALIFLGPDRLPKVTREVLQFIRRLQKLSGDLTRQVNEEIGDLRELDPSYHMRQLMDDEEEEKPTARARQKKGTGSSRQTSAPSEPSVGETIGDGSAEEEEKTIAPETAASTAAPALSDLNTSTSSNGRQQNEDSTETKSTATTIPTAPRAATSKAPIRNPAVGSTPRQTSNTQKRGVKTLAELRKQQQAKRQASSSGSKSTYLEERNKRAQRRADDRREAVAAQKSGQGEESDTEGGVLEQIDAPVEESAAALALEGADGDAQADEVGANDDETPVVAMTETPEESGGEGSEENQA
jgi:sec-independent protein translocase protein TatB